MYLDQNKNLINNWKPSFGLQNDIVFHSVNSKTILKEIRWWILQLSRKHSELVITGVLGGIWYVSFDHISKEINYSSVDKNDLGAHWKRIGNLLHYLRLAFAYKLKLNSY